MGSLNPPPELSLDFKPTFIPKTISQFLGELSRIGSVSEKVLQVNDFVDRLEIETRKIEAFKRELPLCMLLVNDAIVALKEELMVLKKSSTAEPVLEEFLPLKNRCDDHAKVEIIANQKDSGDKKNWLSSTQLWNSDENNQCLNQQPNSAEQIIKKRAQEEEAGRAFISPGFKNPMRGNGLLTKIIGNGRLVSCWTPNSQSKIRTGGTQPPPPQQQTSRKQRRCWSTELHRRFVDALQQLGGSQAATPKQIRELMQVDGLTNDEVKSHLQKYRLHIQRLPSSTTSSSNQSRVVLGGGLWTPPQDQYVGSSKCSNSRSGSPDGPLLNGGNSMDDEDDEKSENYCWNGNLNRF